MVKKIKNRFYEHELIENRISKNREKIDFFKTNLIDHQLIGKKLGPLLEGQTVTKEFYLEGVGRLLKQIARVRPRCGLEESQFQFPP